MNYNTIMSSDCLFCNISKERIILENDLAYAIHDGFPVTEMHSLIIPKRHIYDYFDLTKDELFACDQLIKSLKENIGHKNLKIFVAYYLGKTRLIDNI